MKTKPLSEQIAVVTGGGTGIGRAFTEALAAEGAKVVIADDSPKQGFIHLRNMAHTLIYALSLDRNVVLEDISIYAR